ncbi:MAG TPA: serine/threonine-protein kinase [Pseudomonadota bacterium]|nr:serine/threonine-protein kinase [Pseudomonadota bacterium]
MTQTYAAEPPADVATGPLKVLAESAQPVSQGTSLIGQRIGGYRVVRLLGQGGMGEVYEAVHDHLGQRAVVKTLRSELSHSQLYVQRFFTEARAASLAQHPGMVQVFDFGQLPDRTLYILMEFLAGETLADRMARGPLGETTALRLTRQLASAVAAAHECGIVHRDLKPANVFVVPDPEAPGGERIKILDFGLAKLTDAALGGEGPLSTASGTVMGTPVYMSPEQCRGLAYTNGQTDVYALGVMLFEMLSGKPPFWADTVGDIVAMHLTKPPPPIRDTAPSTTAGVAALIPSMLAKEPAKRLNMAQTVARIQSLAIPEEQSVGRAAGASAPAAQALPRVARYALAFGLGIGVLGAAQAVRSRSRPRPVSVGGDTGPPAVRSLRGSVPGEPAPSPALPPAVQPQASAARSIVVVPPQPPSGGPLVAMPPPPSASPPSPALLDSLRLPGHPMVYPQRRGKLKPSLSPTSIAVPAATSAPEPALPPAAKSVQPEDIDVPALR